MTAANTVNDVDNDRLCGTLVALDCDAASMLARNSCPSFPARGIASRLARVNLNFILRKNLVNGDGKASNEHQTLGIDIVICRSDSHFNLGGNSGA